MKAPGAAALSLLLLAGACRAAPDPIAAQAVPVRIEAGVHDDFADLAPFGRAVGAARVEST